MNRRPNHRSHKGTNNKRRRRTVLGLLLVAILVIVGCLATFERQAIYDWSALHDYTPPPAIAQLAAQDTMTPYARKVFYVNHPKIESKAAFAPVCPNGTEQTVVLGCYHSDQAGIFILQVNNAQLSGVEQVTAAHETLHAIYGRLSSAKRNQVDGWLMDYYQHDLHDPTILAQIAAYKKSEPHAVVNEMHSLFGTEVANLPPQLESYYRQYFTNRSAIVQNYNNYEAAFTTRQQTITRDDQQLTTLKAQIGTDNANLKSQQATITIQQQTLLSERNSGEGATYNAGVPAYNNLVDQYNSGVSAVQALIDQYNQLVAARNALALEEQQLVQALSGNVAPISK